LAFSIFLKARSDGENDIDGIELQIDFLGPNHKKKSPMGVLRARQAVAADGLSHALPFWQAS
jgi:hypothetical protein